MGKEGGHGACPTSGSENSDPLRVQPKLIKTKHHESLYTFADYMKLPLAVFGCVLLLCYFVLQCGLVSAIIWSIIAGYIPRYDHYSFIILLPGVIYQLIQRTKYCSYLDGSEYTGDRYWPEFACHPMWYASCLYHPLVIPSSGTKRSTLYVQVQDIFILPGKYTFFIKVGSLQAVHILQPPSRCVHKPCFLKSPCKPRLSHTYRP